MWLQSVEAVVIQTKNEILDSQEITKRNKNEYPFILLERTSKAIHSPLRVSEEVVY
jgi:hypothetical protein